MLLHLVLVTVQQVEVEQVLLGHQIPIQELLLQEQQVVMV
tara:strand:- start:250 stop:369 length:120 start_codon:yes stop_codon:yes gene_type:complete